MFSGHFDPLPLRRPFYTKFFINTISGPHFGHTVHCAPVESGLGQKMLLSKNSQFLSDHYEILTKEGTHEDLILTKFRNDPVKIVDFLVKAYF